VPRRPASARRGTGTRPASRNPAHPFRPGCGPVNRQTVTAPGAARTR
jgi:hypothetical protein